MIDKKELRIGNYIGFPSTTDATKIVALGEVVSIIKNGNIDAIDVKPLEVVTGVTSRVFGKEIGIPLTDEWLLRLGANERTLHLQEGCYLDISTTYKTAYIQKGLGFSVKYPEFVHQLQNLFFALTGQELKIKEPCAES